MSEVTFRQFVRAFAESWFTKMSGPLTVPFTIAAVFVPQIWLKVLLGLLALACGVSSSYAVWRRERRAFLQEQDKNQKPEVSVRINDLILQRSQVTTTGKEGDQVVKRSTLYLTPTAYFLNLRPPEATIDKVLMEIETPKRVLMPQPFPKAGPVDPRSGIRFIDPNVPRAGA